VPSEWGETGSDRASATGASSTGRKLMGPIDRSNRAMFDSLKVVGKKSGRRIPTFDSQVLYIRLALALVCLNGELILSRRVDASES
jgi:hypothetical protein